MWHQTSSFSLARENDETDIVCKCSNLLLWTVVCVHEWNKFFLIKLISFKENTLCSFLDYQHIIKKKGFFAVRLTRISVAS